jgi:hypothetical protein
LRRNGEKIKYSETIWHQLMKGTIKDLFQAISTSDSQALCTLTLESYQELIIEN